MSKEKEPLDAVSLDRLTKAARKVVDGEIIILMRYSGLHPSVICDSKYNLRVEKDNEGRDMIRWDRPKKIGREAFTSIKKSENIGFNVNSFIKSFQKRKRKKSRQYIYTLVKETALNIGLKGVSPMTLRHSVCVDLLNRGVPEITVMQIFNVSRKTMKTYAKYREKDKTDLLESIGW